MNVNEAQAMLENYKVEFDSARDVIADLAAQMQKDSAEYREQIEKALIRIQDLTKSLPLGVRTSVVEAVQQQITPLCARMTRAVTHDAEASATRAKEAICEVQKAAERTLQAVVSSRWKILLALWGVPILFWLACFLLVPIVQGRKLDELREISANTEFARAVSIAAENDRRNHL